MRPPGAPRSLLIESFPTKNGTGAVQHYIVWHPLNVLRIIFAVLVAGMVIIGLTTRAGPQTARQWRLVWAVIAFLAWALLGFGWLRA